MADFVARPVRLLQTRKRKSRLFLWEFAQQKSPACCRAFFRFTMCGGALHAHDGRCNSSRLHAFHRGTARIHPRNPCIRRCAIERSQSRI